ncbi:MAG: DUF2127 domain-containing protein [Candidatus Woesearchaeota archaeon]
MDKNTAETIVKVFSVLGFIGGAFAIILGILVAIFGTLVGGLFIKRALFLGALAGGFMTMLAFILILFGIVGVVVAWGLWNKKKWARIVEGISGILSLPAFPVGTIFGAVIIYFFLINKDIANIFK